MITERSPQFFCLISRKVRHDHRHFEHLFLKKRYTQGSFQDRYESRVKVRNFFDSFAPGQVRMHQMTLNRSRSNDGDFDHQIVKFSRFHPRQGGHLGATLDLEHPNRVGPAKHIVGCRIVLWEFGQINRMPSPVADLHGVLQRRHHPQTEQIHFNDSQIFAIIFVPLDDGAPGHGGVFQWNNRIQLSFANNHSTKLLPQMTGQSLDGVIDLEKALTRGCSAGRPAWRN